MLEDPSLHITALESGHQALDFARTNNADMVLMDIRMPGMDGVETTQALRRLSSTWARCPIIAVTAHVLSSERQKWLAEGLDDVLTKPIDEVKLQQLLERFLAVTHRLTGSGALPILPNSPTNATKAFSPSAPSALAVIDLEIGARLAGGRRTWPASS